MTIDFNKLKLIIQTPCMLHIKYPIQLKYNSITILYYNHPVKTYLFFFRKSSIIISLKINLFSPWYSWNNIHFNECTICTITLGESM